MVVGGEEGAVVVALLVPVEDALVVWDVEAGLLAFFHGSVVPLIWGHLLQPGLKHEGHHFFIADQVLWVHGGDLTEQGGEREKERKEGKNEGSKRDGDGEC